MIRHKLSSLGLPVLLGFCLIARADQKVLYEKESRYNTIVVTEDDQGLRTLMFERHGPRQSVVKPGDPDHLELAYARAMPVGLAFVDEPQSALVIGLGGGTIPSFLHKHYPRMKIDAVDIDPDVVRVAKEFFGFREDGALHAWVSDGRRFVEAGRDKYDLVFLDAYGPDSIPYRLATREFLQAVRRTLTPRGVVVGNLWSGQHNLLYDAMLRTYQEVFDDLYVFEVQGSTNRILVALPRKQPIERDDLAQRAAKLSEQKKFRCSLGDVVRDGYRHVAEKDPHARILTDKDEPASAR